MGFYDEGDGGRRERGEGGGSKRRKRRTRKPATTTRGEWARAGEGTGGGRGGGKNRDAPDSHEGLRLLAALRQLGGVRRGIEIANAYYGYFPIEGRMLLPGLLPAASRSFSFCSFPPPLPAITTSLPLVLSYALSFVLVLFHFSHAIRPISSLSHPPSHRHRCPLTHIAPYVFLLFALVFSLLLPFPECLCLLPSSFSRCKTEMHTLESVHAVALISSCSIRAYLVTFPQDVNCPSLFILSLPLPPTVRFAFSPSSFLIPHFVLPLLQTFS